MKTTRSHCATGPGPEFQVLRRTLPVTVFQLPKAPRRDKGSCLNSSGKRRSQSRDGLSWSGHFASFRCPSQIRGQMWLRSLKRPYSSPLSSKTTLRTVNEPIVGRRSTGTPRGQGGESEGPESRVRSALPDPAGDTDVGIHAKCHQLGHRRKPPRHSRQEGFEAEKM